MHAKCDKNILCGQELRTFSRTVNGRTSGRTQIVIIVQTQGSYNSSILKLPLEKGIFSPIVLHCILPAFRDSVAGMNVNFICVTCLSQLPDHAKVSDPAEDYILSLYQHFLLHPTACVTVFV